MVKEIKLSWGVTQVSILGPHLFFIYVNYLPLSVKSKSILYRVDTTFFTCSNSPNDLQCLADEILGSDSNWFTSNGL